MRTLSLALFALVTFTAESAFAATCSPGPGVWNEGDGGQGDAGKNFNNANITTGVGVLSTICGNLAETDGTGADMYQIMVLGTTSSASATDRGNSTLDPMLYLFDSSGKALFANDNASGATTDSLISTVSITPGLYFLAIVPAGQEGLNKNGVDLFTQVTGSTTTLSPTSTPKVLKDWSNTGNTSGKYIISLDDAGFAQSPEPSTLAMMGASLLALAGLARKLRA